MNKIYKEGLDQLQISNSLYSQAENLLLEELGLKNYKPIEELSYIVKLSDIKSAHRADADYFQPKYEKIDGENWKQNVKSLGNLVSLEKDLNRELTNIKMKVDRLFVVQIFKGPN